MRTANVFKPARRYFDAAAREAELGTPILARPAGRGVPRPEPGGAGIRRGPEDLRRGRLVGLQLRCRRAQRRRRKGPALSALENQGRPAAFRAQRALPQHLDHPIQETCETTWWSTQPGCWRARPARTAGRSCGSTWRPPSSPPCRPGISSHRHPHVEGARALLHRAIDSGELPADTAVDLLLDSLYGAIVIRMILSPPGESAQLAAEPHRYPSHRGFRPVRLARDYPLMTLDRAGAVVTPARSSKYRPRRHRPARSLI